MGFELFVSYYDHGELANVELERVKRAFIPYLSEEESTVWKVWYDDLNWCHFYLSVEEEGKQVGGFMVSHPCGDVRLWDSLLLAMQQGNGAMYFPDCRHPLVADPAAIPHLPPDMIEVLGEPLIVNTGSEIIKDIAES